MGSRVLGAVDLVCLHQNFRIQKDPVTRTLLEVQTRPRAFRDLPPQATEQNQAEQNQAEQNHMIHSVLI